MRRKIEAACAAQLFNYTLNQFSRRLATVGLPSNVIVTSVAAVDGYTLEAQWRALSAQPPAGMAAPAPAPEPPFAIAPTPSLGYDPSHVRRKADARLSR